MPDNAPKTTETGPNMIIINPRSSATKSSSIGTFVILTLFWLSPASAYTFRPTELDFYFSPEYCKARFSVKGLAPGSGSWVRYPDAGIKRWESMIGPPFHHLHHYCYGKVLLTRIQTRKSEFASTEKVQRAYRDAAAEINYTRSKFNPGNPLWTTITIDFARAKEGAGDVDAALTLLSELQKQSPQDEPIYIALAQTLTRANKTNDAIDVLETAPSAVQSKGSVRFYLAHLYYDLGDIEKAQHYANLAKKAGMKMENLEEKIGKSKDN